MDHYLGTLTDARLAFIPHEALQHLMQMCPRVYKVFWRVTLLGATCFAVDSWRGPSVGRYPHRSRYLRDVVRPSER